MSAAGAPYICSRFAGVAASKLTTHTHPQPIQYATRYNRPHTCIPIGAIAAARRPSALSTMWAIMQHIHLSCHAHFSNPANAALHAAYHTAKECTRLFAAAATVSPQRIKHSQTHAYCCAGTWHLALHCIPYPSGWYQGLPCQSTSHGLASSARHASPAPLATDCFSFKLQGGRTLHRLATHNSAE